MFIRNRKLPHKVYKALLTLVKLVKNREAKEFLKNERQNNILILRS